MDIVRKMKLVKQLLIGLCVIYFLCAIAAIVLGIVVKVGLQKTIPVTDSAGIIAPLILIAAGGLLFLVSLFGFRAVLKEDYAMLAMFVMLLVLIFLALIAVATAGFVFRNRVQSIVRYTINEMMSSYRFFTCKKNRLPMDLVQMKAPCCGANGTADWTRFYSDKASVPDSCCRQVVSGCGRKRMQNSTAVQQEGCQPAVEALLRKQIQWVIIAALVIAFLKVVGIVFACMLIRGIRSGYTVM
uniref:Tetraspanin n=1 Tax=Monopterus albus TaxID=43700 RepID=A0A3Q3JHK4_MONAL